MSSVEPIHMTPQDSQDVHTQATIEFVPRVVHPARKQKFGKTQSVKARSRVFYTYLGGSSSSQSGAESSHFVVTVRAYLVKSSDHPPQNCALVDNNTLEYLYSLQVVKTNEPCISKYVAGRNRIQALPRSEMLKETIHNNNTCL